MKVVLNKEEIKEVILDILCNGGLSYLEFEMDYNEDHYNKVKQQGDSFEDVLYRILEDKGKIKFIDEEYDGDYTKDLTMDLIEIRLSELDDKDFIENILTSLKEESDAETGYSLIQFFLYGEVNLG
tara:strand:+ start:3237 stop:3614 length:378 start_codon:yes stop_codon:yes gene_type:complete